jgi:hypothetical protein
MLWKKSDPIFETDRLQPWFRSAPWSGHRRFVYDLIYNLEPSLTVELGSHYGVSFFAMSQSMKDHALPGRLVAVDTWEGDEHAGFYGEEVFRSFEDLRKSLFGNVHSYAMRMRFDEAVESFDDGSVDILHIDGLHTYEATKQDHEMWQSKLKENGIILFHDVAETTGYGTSAYWNEICEIHPSVSFAHSFGLGVLFPKGVSPICTDLFDEMSLLRDWYELRSKLDLAETQSVDQGAMIDDRDAAIRSMTAMIEDRDAAIRSMTAMIEDRDAAIRSMTAKIEDRDAQIARMLDAGREQSIRVDASVNHDS